MKKEIFCITMIVFLSLGCKNHEFDDFEMKAIFLPTSVGIDMFKGNTYECDADSSYLKQYVFHTDNTVDYYDYSIVENEKRLSSQIHYAYSYNAESKLLYLLSNPLNTDSRQISNNEVRRDLQEKTRQSGIIIYACSTEGEHIVLKNYFDGDMDTTRVYFRYTDGDVSLNFMPYYSLSCYTKNKVYYGIPTFSKNGKITFRVYKYRQVKIERHENESETYTYITTYPIYTSEEIIGIYSFPTKGTDVTGTLTFTEFPDSIQTNWGIEKNKPYTFSQMPTTYILIKNNS